METPQDRLAIEARNSAERSCNLNLGIKPHQTLPALCEFSARPIGPS